MIKVMHVLTDLNIGGAGKSAINLLSRLNKKEFFISCAIPRNSLLAPELAPIADEIYELDGISDRSFSKDAIFSFIRLFNKVKPDIVHTHAGLSARIAAKLVGIKIVYTRHWAGDGKVSIIKKQLNNMLCDTAIGVSATAYDTIIKMGVNPKKAAVVYNGIEPFKLYSNEDKKKSREKYNFNDSHYVIGTAARLEPEKGLEYLLNAAKIITTKHPNVRFIIAGEGSLKASLLELAEKLSLAAYISFPGFIKDMEAFMNCLNLYALPSLTEAFPLNLLEAAAAKVPTVATNCGGNPEIIEHEKTGLLVPSANSSVLAEAVMYMINNEGQALKMSEQAFKKLNERFTAQKMAEEMEIIYRRLVTC